MMAWFVSNEGPSRTCLATEGQKGTKGGEGSGQKGAFSCLAILRGGRTDPFRHAGSAQR